VTYRPLKGIAAAVLLLLVSLATSAQERLRLQIEAGAGVSFITPQNSATRFNSRVLPYAGFSAFCPIAHGISLKTGALYQQKGWEGFTVYTSDTSTTRIDVASRVRFHVLTIPLQLSYAFGKPEGLQYFFAGGISYGFVLSGKEDNDLSLYYNGTLDAQTSDTKKPYIGIIAKDSILKATYNNTMYYRFSPGFRIDAGARWHDRYALQAFWEQSINSISVTDGSASTLKLGYYGLSLAVALNKRKAPKGELQGQ
jgi:hypothetical protein